MKKNNIKEAIASLKKPKVRTKFDTVAEALHSLEYSDVHSKSVEVNPYIVNPEEYACMDYPKLMQLYSDSLYLKKHPESKDNWEGFFVKDEKHLKALKLEITKRMENDEDYIADNNQE